MSRLRAGLTRCFVTDISAFKSGFWTLGPWGKSLPPQLARADRSALAIGLTTTARTGTGWTVETQAGVIANHISADWSTKVLGGLKVKIGAAIGTDSGINGFVDGEGKVTKNARAGMVVAVDLAGGVTMKLKWVLGFLISYLLMLVRVNVDELPGSQD